VLAALATFPGVEESCVAARREIDALLWDRGIRARAADVAAASVIQGARDTAALEGAEVSLGALRSGLDDSPLGRAAAAALAVTAAVPSQVETWQRAPLQVLAHLHALAAYGLEEESAIGRPRATDEVVDPLHIGAAPSPADVSQRLVALGDLVSSGTSAPALVEAAIVHGELMVLRPFRWGSGLVARASLRLVLAARGVDPDLLSCPESGVFSLGRSSYVAALRGYQSGQPGGVAEWIRWNAGAVGWGASAEAPHR
jgi:Fic family protein